jgi:hypothetical protein
MRRSRLKFKFLMTKRNGWSARKLTLLDVELELAIWLLKVAESKLKKKFFFFAMAFMISIWTLVGGFRLLG